MKTYLDELGRTEAAEDMASSVREPRETDERQAYGDRVADHGEIGLTSPQG